MKVYLSKRDYDICGLNSCVYNIYTHPKKCDENKEFLTLENRLGNWLVWFPVAVDNNESDCDNVYSIQPIKFDTLDEAINTICIEISKQVEIITQEK